MSIVLKKEDIKRIAKALKISEKEASKISDYDIVHSKEECAKYLYGPNAQYTNETDISEFIELSDGRYLIVA